jgi:hypothetical protein
MAKKPTPPSASPVTPEPVAPVVFEPTEAAITALVRDSLGGISRRMARRILIERAATA